MPGIPEIATKAARALDHLGAGRHLYLFPAACPPPPGLARQQVLILSPAAVPQIYEVCMETRVELLKIGRENIRARREAVSHELAEMINAGIPDRRRYENAAGDWLLLSAVLDFASNAYVGTDVEAV